MAVVLLASLVAGWFAWRHLGDAGDATSFASLQRSRADARFSGLDIVPLDDASAVERALAEVEAIDCDNLPDAERRQILAVAREFLVHRFSGSADSYISWRDTLPGRRSTMQEQIDEGALAHRHQYLLGQPLAEGATFEAVFPAMFGRGLTAEGRPVGTVRLATGQGAAVFGATVVSQASPVPPRIDAGTFGDVWIGSATLSASSWWRPPPGGSFRELLASGSPFGCVEVGVVLEFGSHGRRAFRLRFVKPPGGGWILDAIGYAGLPNDPNFHMEY